MPPAGHALWAEVGGSITFVTSGGNIFFKNHKNCLHVSLGTVGIYDVGAVDASLSGTAQSPC